MIFTVCVRCCLCKRPVWVNMMAVSSSWWRFPKICSLCWWPFHFQLPISILCNMILTVCVRCRLCKWPVWVNLMAFSSPWWRFPYICSHCWWHFYFQPPISILSNIIFTVCVSCQLCKRSVRVTMMSFIPTWWRFPPVCSLCLWRFFTFSRPSPFCPTWSSLCVWGVASASVQFDAMTWVHLQVVL